MGPSLSSFSHSCKKLDSSSTSYHHHSFISFSNISDDSNDKNADEKRQRTQRNRKILESDDDGSGNKLFVNIIACRNSFKFFKKPTKDKEYSLKDAKKISIVSTSSIDLSSLKGSYSDLSKLKKDEDKLKLKLSPAKDVSFKIKTHKKNPSDPIIMRTCQSVANLSIRTKCEEYPKIILKSNDSESSMFSSDPSLHGNIEVISAEEYEKLHTLTYCKSETSLADSYKKRNKLYFQHKPFKDIEEKNIEVATEKKDTESNNILPDENKNLDVNKNIVHRSSTSDSNDEFFETIKDCNEERDFNNKLNKSLNKQKDINDENKGCGQISTVIINISNEDTKNKNSHCDTPPDDEFYMCFSPEDLKHLQPHTLEKKKSKIKKSPSAVIVVEAASQTSIDLLISGYWAATSANTTEPSSNQYNTHYRTVSLPNIFDVLPSACCALNSLIYQNDQSNISLIQTS